MPPRRGKIHKTDRQIQPEYAGGTITIERLAHGGHGVGSLHGLIVFVPRTAPGDVVDVRVTEQRRRYAFGEVVAVQQASSWRVPAPCALFEACGGCHLQYLSYVHQLASKTVQVQDSLTRIGKLPEVPVAPTLESPQPFAYREWGQIPVM